MVNYTNVKPSGVTNGTNAVLHVGLDIHKDTTVVAVAIRYLVATILENLHSNEHHWPDNIPASLISLK